MKICADNFMCSWRRSGYPARQLFHVELLAANRIQRENIPRACADFLEFKGKSRRRLVAQLNRTAREIDRSAIQSARRTGFESSHLESDLSKILAQA